ncbi:MAG: hypothetical protein AAGE01_19360 [Pseudomonadota bacterium]
MITPAPRSGWGGQLDRLIGPGATRSEIALQFIPPAIAAAATLIHARSLPVAWSAVQLGLLAFLAFDLVGGVITNATSAAKRWFHRPGQEWQQHLGFVGMHVVHLAVVAWLFRAGDGAFFIGTSVFLLGATALILISPLYLQRPVALGLFSLVLLGNTYLLAPTPGLEWFLPLFFLKLLVSHLLYETAYRPDERLPREEDPEPARHPMTELKRQSR